MWRGKVRGDWMIGVVTHTYPNGDFDVWFKDEGFGATCFRQSADVTGDVEAGDSIDCVFADEGRGTVLRATLKSAPRRITAEAMPQTPSHPKRENSTDAPRHMEQTIFRTQGESRAYSK